MFLWEGLSGVCVSLSYHPHSFLSALPASTLGETRRLDGLGSLSTVQMKSLVKYFSLRGVFQHKCTKSKTTGTFQSGCVPLSSWKQGGGLFSHPHSEKMMWTLK